MEILNNESIIEKISGLEQSSKNIPLVSPEIIAPYYLSTSGRIRQLIESGIVEGLKLGRKGLDVRLKTSVPLHAIQFIFEQSVSSKFLVEFVEDNKVIEVQAIPGQSGFATATIGRCINEFRVKTEGLASLVSSPKLFQIRPMVFSIAAMNELLESASKQNLIKTQIQQEVATANAAFQENAKALTDSRAILAVERQQAAAELATKMQELDLRCSEANASVAKAKLDQEGLEKSLTDLIAEKEGATNALAKVNGDIVELQAKLAAREQTLTTVEDLIQQKNQENSTLSEQMKDLRKQVTEWMSKKNHFTAELDGVLSEMNFQIKVYFAFAVVALGMIIALAWQLHEAAERLLATITPDIAATNIWTYGFTRLPFVTVSLAIFYGIFSYALKPLLLKVFELNDLKGLLQARVMLVTKVTQNVSRKLDLSKEEESQVLVEEKMKYIEETLADHFKYRLNAKVMSQIMKNNFSLGQTIAEGINAFTRKEKPILNRDVTETKPD